MDAGAEQSLTARTFPPKLLVGRRFVSSQLRQTSNDGVSGSAPFKARDASGLGDILPVPAVSVGWSSR